MFWKKQRQDYEQKIADGTVRNVFEEAKAPAEDIQASIDYLAKLAKNEHTADSRHGRNQAKNG
jgi:hypothetical protein